MKKIIFLLVMTAGTVQSMQQPAKLLLDAYTQTDTVTNSDFKTPAAEIEARIKYLLVTLHCSLANYTEIHDLISRYYEARQSILINKTDILVVCDRCIEGVSTEVQTKFTELAKHIRQTWPRL